MATTVFVYGSLRAGRSAHALLHGAQRLADGVLDGVVCIEHEGYPMLMPGHGAIAGEVYCVSRQQLAELDAYEEVPAVYARVLRQLRDGRTVSVYMQAVDPATP